MIGGKAVTDTVVNCLEKYLFEEILMLKRIEDFYPRIYTNGALP